MSKKKNSKHLKHNQKTTEKKSYKDDFLGKTVELAPDAYTVYKEKKEAPNSLVIRDNNQPTIDPETVSEISNEESNEKIAVAEAKIDDVLSSLSSDGKKQVVDDIFKSINAEKAEFDNKIKQNSNKENPETLFDKIYTKEFVKPPKTGFFGAIADIFGSQLVWSSVAFALILGVILFYFQGLQPAILDNYAVKARNQSNDLATSYSSQVEKFFSTSASILSSYTYQQGILCSQMTTIENVNVEIEKATSLQFSIFPNQKLKKLENYSYFYDNQIKSEYEKLYTSYSSKLDKYIEPSKDLRDYARFLQFRNNLIKSCGEVEVAAQNLDELRVACAGMLVQFSQFKDDGLPSFWSKVEKPVAAIETDCNSLSPATKSNFTKNFFVQFDDVLFFRPEINDINEQLTSTNQELINQQIPDFKKQVNKIVDDKSTITGVFYLLGFEI